MVVLCGRYHLVAWPTVGGVLQKRPQVDVALRRKEMGLECKDDVFTVVNMYCPGYEWKSIFGVSQ